LIHLARAIQPHGALLVVDEASFIIRQASANTDIHLGLPFTRLTGLSLQCLLPPGDWPAFLNRLQDRNLDAARLYLMVIENLPGIKERVHLFAHRSEGLLLLEFEPAGRSLDTSELDHLSTLSNTLRELRNAASLTGFLDIGLQWLSGFTGFDRVMAYRFNTDGSGQVIAERKRNELESFLGLHYPASDIPAPARRLFGYSPLRHLPDVDYTPVPLMVTEGQAATTRLDMSYLFLRSVSTMYTGYLRNMGVRSALVMPLVTRNNEIWGVISCLNHEGPRYLSYERRVPVEYLGQSLSLMIHDRHELEHYEYQLGLDAVLDELIRNLGQSEDLHETLCTGTPHLLSTLRADGVVLCYDGRRTRMGKTPDHEALESLIHWLTQKDSAITATHRLRQDGPESIKPDGRCGLLSVRLSKFQPDWIIWFREETPRDIDWAGNPQKPVEIDPDQHEVRLLPRTSFARWRQTVKGESAIWQDCEVEYANRLRHAIFGIIVERTRQLERLNRELLASVAKNQRIREELETYRNELEQRVEARTQALHRQSRFLRVLIDHLPHQVWLKDIEGRILTANRALALSYHLEPSALEGLKDADLRLPEQAASCQSDENHVMQTGIPLIREAPLDQMADSLYETYLAAVFDDENRILGTVGFARDIKPQRRLETELALRVREAETAIRAKSAFLANMSHEIRTPLTAIIGFAENLLETAQSPKERNQSVQTILRNGRHLQELIANILDFSRLEAEEHPIEPGNITLLPLLGEVHALAVSLAQGRQLAFSTHLLPPLAGNDPERCHLDPANPDQPDRQCRQIHPCTRQCAPDYQSGPCRRTTGNDRAGYRHRH
jgi:light-regulated signal transduction histidine kinase (bacteriophytochrome)